MRKLKAISYTDMVVQKDGKLSFRRVRARPFTKRQEEIHWEKIAKSYADYWEAQGSSSETMAQISKWIRGGAGQWPLIALFGNARDYEKAYYGKCWKSEKKRKAFDVLRALHNAAINDTESGHPRKDSDQLTLLAPLLSALKERDSEFCKGLTQAVQILNDRIYSSKDKTIGSGDSHLGKWLLEYKIRIWPHAEHTVRELKDQFVSKFRAISDKELHEKLHELGIPHKDEPRGKASPNYGKAAQLNLPPKRKKKGKF